MHKTLFYVPEKEEFKLNFWTADYHNNYNHHRHNHIMTLDAYILRTHPSEVIIGNRKTDNVLYELYVSTLNQVCNFS